MTDYLQHPYAPWIVAGFFFLMYVRQTVRVFRLQTALTRLKTFALCGVAVSGLAGFSLGRFFRPRDTEVFADE